MRRWSVCGEPNSLSGKTVSLKKQLPPPTAGSSENTLIRKKRCCRGTCLSFPNRNRRQPNQPLLLQGLLCERLQALSPHVLLLRLQEIPYHPASPSSAIVLRG